MINSPHTPADQRERSRPRLNRVRLAALAATAMVLAMLLGTARPATAQETGGAVSGTIVDPQKAALPGVTVTLVKGRDTPAGSAGGERQTGTIDEQHARNVTHCRRPQWCCRNCRRAIGDRD